MVTVVSITDFSYLEKMENKHFFHSVEIQIYDKGFSSYYCWLPYLLSDKCFLFQTFQYIISFQISYIYKKLNKFMGISILPIISLYAISIIASVIFCLEISFETSNQNYTPALKLSSNPICPNHWLACLQEKPAGWMIRQWTKRNLLQQINKYISLSAILIIFSLSAKSE